MHREILSKWFSGVTDKPLHIALFHLIIFLLGCVGLLWGIIWFAEKKYNESNNTERFLSGTRIRYEMLDTPQPRTLSSSYLLALTEHELEKNEHLHKIGNLIPERQTAITAFDIETYIGRVGCDVFLLSEGKSGTKYVLYRLVPSVRLQKKDLIGFWAQVPHHTHESYPGTYRFFGDDHYEYQSNYQETYQQYYTGHFQLDNTQLTMTKDHDLWPTELSRTDDQQAIEWNYYGIDPDLTYTYKMYPFQTNADHHVTQIIVESYFQNTKTGKKWYELHIFEKIAEDPTTEVTYRLDWLAKKVQ